MHKFTEEQIKFIREIAPGRYAAEITEMVNNRFNLELRVSQIETCKRTHKIRSGIDCRFQKGMIPANKGKKGSMSPKQYEKCKATMFKKGQVPQNHKPVGSERIDRDGYVLIKVAEPNKWRPKHRVLWEKTNGPIPEKHRLIFADGNRQNITLDNLILVSYAQSFIMNQKDLFKNDKELTKAGVAVAKVLDKVNKRKKEI
nr:MAG TPA: HNH endonuclease [Caudoviricetes sp.]